VQVSERSITVRFDDDGQAFVRMNALALIGMSAAGKTLSPDERQRLLETSVSDSAPLLNAHTRDGSLTVDTRSNLAMARG